MSNQISDYAAAWKAVVPPEAYRLAGSHAVFQQQVSVMSAIQADVSTIKGALSDHGIQISNLASQVSSVGSGSGSGSGGSFSGVLDVSQGGTGLSVIGSADQVLGVSHDGSSLEYKSLLGVSGDIVVTGASGSLSFDLVSVGTAGSYGSATQVPVLTLDGKGRVTGVADTGIAGVSLSAPSQFAVSGSPFAPGGSVSFGWLAQNANLGLFGPSSGSAGLPSFRSLVLGDLPAFYSGVGSPSQGAVLYVGSSGSLVALGAGTAFQALLSGGPSANPSWGSVVNSLTGTAHQVSVSGSFGAVTLSLPQSIDSSSSPSFASLSLSSPLAVGSGGTGVVSTSQSFAFIGPSSGSGAPSWRSLVSSDLPLAASGAVGAVQLTGDFGGSATSPEVVGLWGNAILSPSGTGTFLKWTGSAFAWATPTTGAGGSSGQVQFNSSGTLSGDAGFTYGGVGGSTLVTLSPSGTSATALALEPTTGGAAIVISPQADGLTWISGQAKDSTDYPQWINFTDSSGNLVLNALEFSTGQTNLEISGVTGGADPFGRVRLTWNTAGGNYATNGVGMGGITFVNRDGSSSYAIGSVSALASQNHSSSAMGTCIGIYAAPLGTTASRQVAAFYGGPGATNPGDAVMNSSGVSVATSATYGFLWIHSMAGPPSGTPSLNFVGAAAAVVDSSDGVLYLNPAGTGNWSDAGRGRVKAITSSYSVLTTDRTVVCNGLQSSGYSLTLPLASNVLGQEFEFVVGQNGSSLSAFATISRQSSDVIYAGTSTSSQTSVKLGASGPGAAYSSYVKLKAIATGVFQMVGAL